MHVKRILVFFSLATATLTAGSWFCTAQSAAESCADQAAHQRAGALLKPDDSGIYINASWIVMSNPRGAQGALPALRLAAAGISIAYASLKH